VPRKGKFLHHSHWQAAAIMEISPKMNQGIRGNGRTDPLTD
jgi:hypothetical protein